MKGNMFCASQASTAICSMSSMDQASSSSSSTIHLGSTPFIDRHNPIIRDGRRIPPKNIINTPCSFQAPISPKPHKNHHKNQNTKPRDYLVLHKKKSKKQSSGDDDDDDDQKKKKKISSATAKDQTDIVKNKSFAKPSDLFTPPGSSRYLLGGDTAFFNVLSDIDPVLALVPAESKKIQAVKTDESSSSSSKRCSSSRSPDQVVVLRVSLHCKGCEGKVRKHISRMAGVTSFNIDFAAKKVTVVGDVTPLSVLASISKVKNAQLLTPAMLSSSSSSSNHPSSVGSNYIATNK